MTIDRPLEPDSERAMLYGSTRYTHDDDDTPMARPVTWKGKPAVAAVVVVLDPDGAVLDPHSLRCAVARAA